MDEADATDLSIGRYVLYDSIAAGGMASVHVGRQTGAVGFARTVAIKRLHRAHATNPEFVSMFVDEARLAARIHHPNVVTTLDVVFDKNEVFLVMEYVHGEPLSGLLRAARKAHERVPIAIVSSVMVGMLQGLHAAHEAKDEAGAPLGIVHRDISPQNVIVGVDGVSRLLDFGVAKANVRLTSTGAGQLKGKLAYMAPEQFAEDRVSRASDVYACGIVLWELLVGRAVFADIANQGALVARILEGSIPRLHGELEGVPDALCDVVAKAHARLAADRYATARELAMALEAVVPPASAMVVGGWVSGLVGAALERRATLVAEIEQRSNRLPSDVPGPQVSRFRIEDEPTASQYPTTTFVRPAAELLPDAPEPPASDLAASNPPAEEPLRRVEVDAPPAPKTPSRWLFAMLALLIGAASALLIARWSRAARDAPAAAGPSSTAPADAPGPSAPPAVASGAPSPAPPPADSGSAPPEPLASSRPQHPRSAAASPIGSGVRAAAPACLPPYTLVPMYDDTGAPVLNKDGTQKTMKRPKPHCLPNE